MKVVIVVITIITCIKSLQWARQWLKYLERSHLLILTPLGCKMISTPILQLRKQRQRLPSWTEGQAMSYPWFVIWGPKGTGPVAPCAQYSLLDAVDGVTPPQALIMPCSPRQAVVLQSLPIFVKVFLLWSIRVQESVVFKYLKQEEGPFLTPSPKQGCMEKNVWRCLSQSCL